MIGTQEIIQQFYNRREARLRTRMNESTDLIGKYRLLRAIYQNRKNTIDKFGKSVTIKSQDISSDGGPGSGNHGHEGVPGQVGGSAPSGAKGLTKFERRGGKMSVTSEVKIKADGVPATLKAGTTVRKIVNFAGGHGKKPVSVEPHLVKQYGGKAGSWTHTRGEAKVVLQDGSEKMAEIHWFESKDVGQVGMKVKRYLKEKDNES